MFHSIWILLQIALHVKLSEESEKYIPRVKTTKEDGSFKYYTMPRRYQRVELLQGPLKHTVYAAGGSSLFYLDFQAHSELKEVPVFQNECKERNPAVTSLCDYDITVLHEHKNGSFLFICGTNGKNPVCCNMSVQTGACETYLRGEGVAPFSVDERAPSLFVGEELYATANVFGKGDGVGIRRHFGTRGKVWSQPNITEQIFLGLAVSPRSEQVQNRIYAFLVEKNKDRYREAEPWVSLVMQVCQADRGGPKSILQNRWTSQLSARLSCGLPGQRQYFSKLLDMTVLEKDDWRHSRVYALFSNSWGMRAVCVFTMEDIDRVFTTSKFRGQEGQTPKLRPGSCMEDSASTPYNVLAAVMDHSEMEDWVRPMNDSSPLLISHRHYSHIRVDSVTGWGNKSHYVILLTLEDGRVHKVLEQAGEVFFIAELQPFINRSHIHSVLLQPYTKMLYVSSSNEVVELDLHGCRAYGQHCEDCIQARDPYCGWDGSQCTAVSSSTLQDVEHGDHLLCRTPGEGTNSDRSSIPSKVHKLYPPARYYLQCPMHSAHATYKWLHHNTQAGCLIANAQCLLLMEAVTPEQAGTYVCMASEKGYTKAVVQYELSVESKAPGLVPTCLLFLLVLLN